MWPIIRYDLLIQMGVRRGMFGAQRPSVAMREMMVRERLLAGHREKKAMKIQVRVRRSRMARRRKSGGIMDWYLSIAAT